MPKIGQSLTSMEVAQMIGKDHSKLLRDIRNYVSQLGEAKIGFTDFFSESTYTTEQNKIMPCYLVTKKGCEFIANKLTGTKGTIFTARYINRFHEMETELKSVPAAGKKKITFLQEIKAAEHVVKGLDQAQKIAFYKSIYERHGLHFDIQPNAYIEDKQGSYCDQYRNKSIEAIRKIRDERRLRQIYTISKNLLKFDMKVEPVQQDIPVLK